MKFFERFKSKKAKKPKTEQPSKADCEDDIALSSQESVVKTDDLDEVSTEVSEEISAKFSESTAPDGVQNVDVSVDTAENITVDQPSGLKILEYEKDVNNISDTDVVNSSQVDVNKNISSVTTSELVDFEETEQISTSDALDIASLDDTDNSDVAKANIPDNTDEASNGENVDSVAVSTKDTVESVDTKETNESVSKKAGFFSRLKAGLKRTSSNFSAGIGALLLGKKEINEDLLEELETHLLVADIGIEATQEIINTLTTQVSRKELSDAQALYKALQKELAALLIPSAKPLEINEINKPYVILMVGVNGVGKTTTIGKLAKRFQAEGKSVMLAAGDTFRAAAVEQLQVWGDRNNVPVVAQHTGADSASVIFDALQAAQARNVDVLIADTAGRLHNKDNLMEELKKVVRVMGKLDESAPHEVMLVLDAGTGQNALSQAQHFQQAVGVTGITLTKLDGTAKGGIIFAISKQLQLPIRFIGVGEQAEDLRPFNADEFVDALFKE